MDNRKYDSIFMRYKGLVQTWMPREEEASFWREKNEVQSRMEQLDAQLEKTEDESIRAKLISERNQLAGRYSSLRSRYHQANFPLIINMAKRKGRAIKSRSFDEKLSDAEYCFIKAFDEFDVSRKRKFSSLFGKILRNYFINASLSDTRHYSGGFMLPINSEDFDRDVHRPFLHSLEKDFKGLKLDQIVSVVDSTSGVEQDSYTEAVRQYIFGEDSPFNEKYKAIIELRFGLNGQEPKNLKEIGQILGITRERVRQLEGKILKKLRVKFEAKV